MTQDGQFELTDFLGKKIESKSVMDLTAWINSQGKAQYTPVSYTHLTLPTNSRV